MRVLVVNAGSSSLKLSVLELPAAGRAASVEPAAEDDGAGPAPPVAERHVEDWDGEDTGPVAELLADAGPVDAVGHRVVHGGVELQSAVLIDDEVVAQIEALAPLAPLHQERSLAGITALRGNEGHMWPSLPRSAGGAAPTAALDLPQVACFDTAYHATIPEAAATYALPAVWRERWPLRRFGFHGLSHAYAARRAADLVAGAAGGLRVVTCHLGAGASLCASLGGRSVDTTMGFTPLDGLVMATRSGSVDPGLVLWLVTDAGLAPDAVRTALEHDSGLMGLAGTSDMREVVAAGGLALDVYVHVLVRQVAAMTAALGGLDALVFTGGVGEHSPDVRALAAERLAYLGVAFDESANRADPDGDAPDRAISAPGTPVTTLVVEAREDIEIARQTRAALSTRARDVD